MRILILLGAGLLLASAHAYDPAVEGYIRKPSLGIRGQAPINYFGAADINHLQESYQQQTADFPSQSNQEIDESFNQQQATDLFSSSKGDVELSSGDYVYDKPSQPFKDTSNSYLPPLGSLPSDQVPAFSAPPKDETGQSSDDSPAIALPSEEPVPEYIQLGCAAALVCVEEEFCDLAGVKTRTANTFTPAQLLRRVPMITCRNPDNGIIGKCCRDPDYVDPWPTGNLPANYSGGFDEQGFPSFLNIAKTRPAKPTTTAKPEVEDDITFQDNSASNVAIQTLLLPGESVPVKTQTRFPQPVKTVTTQQYYPTKEPVPAPSSVPSNEYLPVKETKPAIVYIPVKKPQPAPAPVKNVFLVQTTRRPIPTTQAPIRNVYLQQTTPKPVSYEYLPPAPTPAPIKNEYLPPATTRPTPRPTPRPTAAPVKTYIPPSTTQAPKPAPIRNEYLPPPTTQAPKPAPVKIQYIPPSTTLAPKPVKNVYLPPTTTRATPRPTQAPIKNVYLQPTKAPYVPVKTVQKPAPPKNYFLESVRPKPTVVVPSREYLPVEQPKPKPTVVVPSREYLPVEQTRPSAVAQSNDYGQVLENNNQNYVIELTKKQTAYIQPHTPGAQCGLKNKVTRVDGLSPEDVGFGEIPWQVMILSNSEKKLLCGGVLVAPNAIVTTASCVEGRPASDVSIKVGEWKLGYDLKWEEPLPFEIVQVSKIVAHFNWSPKAASYDQAVLLLEHNVKYDQHVDAICLAPGPYPVANKNCFATGWGKIVLQVHKEGALMHGIDIDLLSQNECKERLQNAETQLQIDDSMVCGKAKHQRNNVCQVDFGGPLVCDRGDGFYELVGVYSRETGCLPTNQVATFSVIDNEWVRSVISGKQHSGFVAQSHSGFEAQSHSGFEAQSHSRFEAQSHSGFKTQSHSGFAAQTHSTHTDFPAQSHSGFVAQTHTTHSEIPAQSHTGFVAQTHSTHSEIPVQSHTGFVAQSHSTHSEIPVQSHTGFVAQTHSTHSDFPAQTHTGFVDQSHTTHAKVPAQGHAGFAAQSTAYHQEGEECPCKKKTSQSSASSGYSQFQLASNQQFLPPSY